MGSASPIDAFNASLSLRPDRRKSPMKHWNLSNSIFGGGKSANVYLVFESTDRRWEACS